MTGIKHKVIEEERDPNLVVGDEYTINDISEKMSYIGSGEIKLHGNRKCHVFVKREGNADSKFLFMDDSMLKMIGEKISYSRYCSFPFYYEFNKGEINSTPEDERVNVISLLNKLGEEI